MTASSFTDEVFEGFWHEAKENLRELSKKDLAEEMFHAGATNMLHAFMLMTNKEFGKEMKEK